MRLRLGYLILVSISLLSCKRESSKEPASDPMVFLQESELLNEKPTVKSKRIKVKMTKRGGVYEIPIKLNGIEMDAIFDTGASGISISATEALYLIKQNRLNEDDFLGEVDFIDATGNINQGTAINLRVVEIGGEEIYNISASIVHNISAPILLGQSALSKFGEVTIDYIGGYIYFE